MNTEPTPQRTTEPGTGNPSNTADSSAHPLLRGVLYLVDVLLILSVLMVPISWLLTQILLHIGPIEISISWGIRPLLAPFVVGIVRLLLKRKLVQLGDSKKNWLWDRTVLRKLTLSIITSWVAVVAVEQILEKFGFEADVPPIVIKGENDEVCGKYGILGDPVFTWKFSPGGEFKGWKINAIGFRDREVTEAKAPGAIRVICFGDSCTADGGPPYSGCLHQLLRNDPPTEAPWEAFNMAVYGYSSVQGLKVFQLKGKQLKPDIVTLYFGWNDHWMCGYRPDSNNQAFSMGPVGGFFGKLLRRKRFGQLLIKAMTPGRNVAIARVNGELPADIEERYRVPPDEYRYTLSRFVREARETGALPVIITAPRGPVLTHHLVNNGQGSSIEQLDRAHAQYIKITREVAQEMDVELLDLADMFDNEESYPLFNGDGIHLTQDGLWRIGEAIHEKLKQVTLTPAWQERNDHANRNHAADHR